MKQTNYIVVVTFEDVIAKNKKEARLKVQKDLKTTGMAKLYTTSVCEAMTEEEIDMGDE